MIAFNANRLVKAVGGPDLHIPKEGWNAQNFARYGYALIVTMHRVALIAQRQAARKIAPIVREVFRDQVRRVIRKAMGGRKAPDEFIFSPGQHEDLWLRALQEVFAEQGGEMSVELLPEIQSVVGQGYSKTNIMLGQADAVSSSVAVANTARGIAQKITKIDQTTRDTFERVIRDGIADGKTGAELAKQLEERVADLSRNRSLTIARTESSNAWHQGATQSFKASNTCTHVSIIGCAARESNSPQWRGESTCNATDIPIAELDAFNEIGFHVNHTGTMIASGFRNDDGSDTEDAPRPSNVTDDSAPQEKPPEPEPFKPQRDDSDLADVQAAISDFGEGVRRP